MRLWNKAYLPMVKWSLTQSSQKNVKRIVDVGVGNGLSTLYLGAIFSNAIIYGIDISPEAIKQAKKRKHKSAIIFEEKSVEHTKYESHSFDLICAFQNHFHWENLEQSFLELKRIVTKDGRILLACELTKIRYYLPEWQNEAQLVAYLHKFELHLHSISKEKNWICYEIVPVS